MFGFHLQQPTNNWLDAVKNLPANTPIKAIDNGGFLIDAKQINNKVFTIYRHWYDPGQVFGGTLEQNKQRARNFLNTFVDETFKNVYAPYIDGIEDFNEYFDSRHVPLTQRQWLNDTYGINYNPEFLLQEYIERLTWIKALSEVWKNEYQTDTRLKHIKLICGNVPIGNDIPLEFARIVQQYNNILSYHAYIYTLSGSVRPEDDLYLSGRWKWNDHYFKINGVTVDWISTEGGPYANVLDGWRHENVCNNNVECYKEALYTFGGRTYLWNTQNNNRFRGVTLFTTTRDNDPQWKYYQTIQPEMNEISLVSQEFPIMNDTTPPYTWNKVVYLLPQQTTLEEYDSVRNIAYPTRSEIAFSADSAFDRPNNVKTHKVFVYAVERWGGKIALENYLTEKGYIYNPSTIIEYREFEDFLKSGDLVIDISHYQQGINLVEAREDGVKHVIVKASEWKVPDPRFLEHVGKTLEAKLGWSAYHFYTNNSNPFDQVDTFINLIIQAISVFGEKPLRLYLDLEQTNDLDLNAVNNIKKFLDILQETLETPIGIYTGSWWITGHLLPAVNYNYNEINFLAQYELWLAHYDDDPPTVVPLPFEKVHLWQQGRFLNVWNVFACDVNYVM